MNCRFSSSFLRRSYSCLSFLSWAAPSLSCLFVGGDFFGGGVALGGGCSRCTDFGACFAAGGSKLIIIGAAYLPWSFWRIFFSMSRILFWASSVIFRTQSKSSLAWFCFSFYWLILSWISFSSLAFFFFDSSSYLSLKNSYCLNFSSSSFLFCWASKILRDCSSCSFRFWDSISSSFYFLSWSFLAFSSKSFSLFYWSALAF